MRERLAAILLAAASAGLIAAIPAWRGPLPPAEAYAEDTETFSAKVEAMVARHATGRDIDGVPVVRPPEGDVYLKAERWRYYPALELEAGKRYRLHASSADVAHSLVLGSTERLLLPGRVEMVDLVAGPDVPAPQCAEYCGNGHYKMKGTIEVVAPGKE